MSNLLIINALICAIGFFVGVHTFIKHLKAFSSENASRRSVACCCWYARMVSFAVCKL